MVHGIPVAVVTALAAASWAHVVGAAGAEGFPNRPARLIVPFPPGGPADILGRALAEKFHKLWGQPVVVLNKDGAGTIIGVDLAAKATPDGHTMLLGSSAMTINSGLGRKLPYDLYKDLEPVSMAFRQPLVLIVHPSVQATNVREFVALAKAQPGRLRYGSSGVATSIHLTTALFASATGIELMHIPYKGVAPAMIDLLAGQVEIVFSGITGTVQHIRSGRLRGIGVSSRTRSPLLPELPTFIEAGVADFEVTGWYGLVLPAGVPRPVFRRIQADLKTVVEMPDVRERLAQQGGEGVSMTPEAFAEFIRSEVKRWGSVVRSAGIRME
jgi:tripartite-type tricarboxylate transporter receptor subunit TctC